MFESHTQIFIYYYDSPGVSCIRGRMHAQDANGVLIEPLRDGITATSERWFYPYTAIQRMAKA